MSESYNELNEIAKAAIPPLLYNRSGFTQQVFGRSQQTLNENA
jgi:hypothetical protein